jgi:NAD(P)-dependent dehydrogenase (short-subunit alcohol dehydrogenase family)
MRVCIVGASGKRGRYMVEHSLDRGYEVVAVCREQSVGKLAEFCVVSPAWTSHSETRKDLLARVSDGARTRGRRDHNSACLNQRPARFWAGCNALTEPLYPASELRDLALEPSGAPGRHRSWSNLDPGLTPSASRRRAIELAA